MFFADDLVAAVALVASKFPNISSNFVHHLYEIYEMYEKLYNKPSYSRILIGSHL